MSPKGTPKADNSASTSTPRDRGASGAAGPAAVPKAAPATKPAAGTPPAGASATRPGRIKFNPPADWDAFFKPLPDVSEAQILLDVGALRGRKDFVGIENALKAYLKYFPKHATPWMYEQLSTAMEINGRSPSSVKEAMGWGAYLARKGNDPVALIAACDQMMAHKYDEIALTQRDSGTLTIRLDDLLDRAIKAAPHRAEPILMSLVLADRHADPQRLEAASESLLSLGWPGADDTWRAEVRKRFASMSKRLREENRGAEAKALAGRLAEIESRDVVIRLTWEGDALLDLVVDEPLGISADHFNPRTVFGGAIIKEGRGKDHEAIYVCPRGFSGDYTARVNVLFNDEHKPALVARLEMITHEGTDREKVTRTTLPLSKLEPARVTLADGRRKVALPYLAPNAIKTLSDEPPAPRRDVKAPAGAGGPATPKP